MLQCSNLWKRLNELNRYLLFFPEEVPTPLTQGEISEILDQAKPPNWHEAMISANIDIFEMDYEAAISYFMQLENLDKIRCTNGPTVAVDNNIPLLSSVGLVVAKKKQKSKLWCHFCDKTNHNTAECQEIAKAKQHKKAQHETKAVPGKRLYPFFSKKLLPSKSS
jgi:hypothetical protein